MTATTNRTPRLPLIAGGAVVVVVAVVVGAYFAFFRGSSKPRLTLSTPAAGASSGLTPATAVGKWTVGPASTAGYRVREKLAMLPAQSDAVGRTSGVTGTATIASAGAGLQATAADFTIDLTSLTSDRSQRDHFIQAHGLDSATFPTARFVLSQPVALPANCTNGQIFADSAVGNLTLHGETHQITIPLQAKAASGRVDVVGSYTFPMAMFGISPPSIGGFVSVTPNATLEFSLVLTRA